MNRFSECFNLQTVTMMYRNILKKRELELLKSEIKTISLDNHTTRNVGNAINYYQIIKEYNSKKILFK